MIEEAERRKGRLGLSPFARPRPWPFLVAIRELLYLLRDFLCIIFVFSDSEEDSEALLLTPTGVAILAERRHFPPNYSPSARAL